MALSKLKKFATAYKEEIICNPTFATEVECGLKCVSYLISGKFMCDLYVCLLTSLFTSCSIDQYISHLSLCFHPFVVFSYLLQKLVLTCNFL